MAFDFDYTLALFPILFRYLGTTMEMALLGFVFALLIAGVLAVVRTFKLFGLNVLARLFISFFVAPLAGTAIFALLRPTTNHADIYWYQCL